MHALAQTQKPETVSKLMMTMAFSLFALCALFLTTTQSHAASNEEIVKKITTHFASIPTMQGEFIQFNQDGGQVGGKFFLQRPGKVRFNYDKPYPIRMISNGKSIVINNTKLKTWDIYPLSQTPLKLLLADKIKLTDKDIRTIKVEKDLVTIVLGDKSVFGDSTITLLFDANTYELRQWNIIDKQGKETSVLIFNVENNVALDKKLFHIDFRKINRLKQDRKDKGR